MSTILVAIDGSDESNRAFETAADLAAKVKSDLYLVTVIDAADAAPSYIEGVTPETTKALDKRAEMTLMGYVERAQQEHGVHAEFGVWHGFPPKAIVEVAKEKNASMIVIGTRGRGKAKELLLGSVAHDVARNSTVPVLIAK
ncbi:MAG TPA: universal stress protein [Nitrososphaera sp.]|nr:universal stress protein [Nitrososphaera sp.]